MHFIKSLVWDGDTKVLKKNNGCETKKSPHQKPHWKSMIQMK